MTSEELAKKIRIDCIKIAHGDKNVHIGGCLSESDILAVLYQDIMHIDPLHPNMENRDYLIISKGHASSAVYAVLAETGFITKEELFTQYQDGSRLSGHVSHKVEGVEISTGSLGHGLAIGCGIASSFQIDKKDNHVYVLLGDGECEEGSIWEAALYAGAHKLENLTVIIDYNQLQSGDTLENVAGFHNPQRLFEIAGWNVIEVDGHQHDQLRGAFLNALRGKPTCICAHTIKGKGVSFMEHEAKYHSARLDDASYQQAIMELEG